MELENRTPVVARIDVGAPLPNGLRRGIVTAKATYRYDARGAVALETQDPDPVRLRDEETPLGTLPCDAIPRLDEAFEVALLGSAHAPAGDRVAAMRVALTVGERRRELAVFGDRAWEGEGEAAVIPRPTPFERMPLSWARAFGGTTDVLVDDESPVEVMHMANPAGRGFDPAPHARGLDEQLTCPPGYPRWDRRRPLPNVERPDALIRAWDHAPDPAGWSPVNPATDMHMRRAVRLPADAATRPVGEGVEVLAGMHHRAHPDWVFDRAPAAGTAVRLEGLDPAGAISFALPALEVWLDYQLGARTGARRLALHGLTIFNDVRRFTLTYRLPFQLELPKGEARQARLRVEGWQ